MVDELLFLLYLDQRLIKDLHSTVISGFVESETIRYSVDTSNSNRFKLEVKDKKEKEGIFNSAEEVQVLSTSDCYTLKTVELENKMETEFASEDRRINKKDIEHKKTFFSSNIGYSSCCVFFNPVWDKMKQIGTTKSIGHILSEDRRIADYCCAGEFVEFYGELTTISIKGYIKKILDIIEAYSAETLNEILMKVKFAGDLKFEIINRMLKQLYQELQAGGTEDLVIKVNNRIIILNVCTQEFDASMYDNSTCKCRIWGKICKLIGEQESINLLRKTGHVNYYECLLKSFEPYFDCLRNNSVLLPQRPPIEIVGPSILIKPISIHQ